jgi:hypothetical protein
MTKWIGLTLIATTAAFGVAADPAPAMAASAAAKKAQSAATDVGLHRYSRHRYRTIDQPSYYGRPRVYAPAPFVPIPPFFGYGWEWW